MKNLQSVVVEATCLKCYILSNLLSTCVFEVEMLLFSVCMVSFCITNHGSGFIIGITYDYLQNSNRTHT